RIGDWVFREAARQAAAWRAEGLTDLQVSINLSPKQLHAGDLYFDGWFRHLKALNLPGSSLIIELTEDMLVDNSPPTLRVLGALREHKLTIAIDDFGTGYSNLNALGGLDAQYLKIDRGFVMALPESERSQSLCRAITSLGHALGLQVVAEGIETQAQADFLRSIGCEHGQGYLFAKPMFAPELGALLHAA
ncbi:MAG: EAL domain-containing protein, partial [Rhodocyclaceae bacterium]|nr:EAL domain-containing protein [Rhodocyclaceae bacterium]